VKYGPEWTVGFETELAIIFQTRIRQMARDWKENIEGERHGQADYVKK
jgi:hypothetical protein